MKRLLVGAMLTLAVSAAQAEMGTHSEFFWQAQADTNAFNADLTNTSTTTTPKNATEDNTQSLTGLGLRYDRGLNENWSVGGQLNYATGASKDSGTESDISGLGDIKVFAQGFMPMGENGKMYYGADVNLAMGNGVMDSTGTKTTMTPSEGGMGFTPFVGYQMVKWNAFVGAKLAYTLWGERKWDAKTAAGTTTDALKVTGGNTMDLVFFYERPMDTWSMGVDLGMRTVGESETTVAPATTGTTADGHSSMLFDAYAKFDMAENFELVPAINYESVTSAKLEGADIDKSSNLGISVKGRFIF